MRRGTLDLESSLFDISLDQLTLLAQVLRQAESIQQELALLAQQVAGNFQASHARRDEDLHGHETVLVADDHPVVRAIARDILESFGYRVVFPSRELGRHEAEYDVDIVLMDLSVGDTDRLASARLWAPTAGLVACAPLPEGAARDRLRACGVRGFVSKPYQPRELVRCIRRVMRGC